MLIQTARAAKAVPPTDLNLLQAQLDLERRMVSFDSYDMTVRQIFEMFVEDAIFVPPEYQRQFVWDPARSSQLIESIFLGIPVPSLFMATNSDATWEIVDGVQRMSTLIHFMAGAKIELLERINREAELTIDGLEKVTELNGKRYSDLPKSLQLLFQTRPIRVTVLNDKSDLSVRFDLFERLNTGGVLLSNQEIRNCIFRGPFNEQLKKLATDTHFRTAVRLKDSDTRNGTAQEYVLRFFAYLDDRQKFQHSVKGFLNDYMKGNARQKIAPTNVKLFKNTMSLLATAFPNGITRGQASTTSAVLFEALSIGLAEALRSGKRVKHEKLPLLVADARLKTLTTGATNSNKMLSGRIDHVIKNLTT
ncbi:hypothetical protein PMI16_00562 [Herbaspirillum sp. CF444]|uniref:DUF262 domain-containing protein n=1 Tax=Herbaspirillum sp. CF444 TaxID=1144319 RepID=UPI0002727E1F|nr:DUF262 domain-containing protein [Herbaspirillum sp. CF444]EJL93512.1 hypothetical protein PMI16_00562 [Herbaspirillum sp. CF444]